MSISGGLHKAFDRIRDVDGTALQIFTRNQRQWKIPPLSDDEVETFRQEWKQWGDYPVVAHDSYLVNLAADRDKDTELYEKSVRAFATELERCERLGLTGLVTHPGAHKGMGMEAGIRTYAANLDEAIADSGTSEVPILLETTAGQGTVLGSTFGELAAIIKASEYPDRLRICYDTCHTFAAGYDLRTEAAYTATFDAFDDVLGLDLLACFHVNDTKNGLDTHKDRHEHIGHGELGEAPFRYLMRDERFVRVPMVLETPKGESSKDELAEDRENLAVLRTFADED